MEPLVPTRIPRAVVIVMIPIGADGKFHDRNPEARRIRVQRNVATLITIDDVRCIHPAAIVLETDITPTPVIQTTIYLDRSIGINLRYDRIAIVRAGIDVCRVGRYGILSSSYS